MAVNRTYLITGANRGIGKGLVANLLERPSTTVLATVRDTAKAAALKELPKADGARLIIVNLDSKDTTGGKAMVKLLQSEYGIDHLDVVIANAAINDSPGPVSAIPVEQIEEHFRVNTIGPVTLFQAVRPLLEASRTRNPVFVPITSGLGTIAGQERLATLSGVISPYGATKAALNWFTRRIHFEEPWLTSFVMNPGLVETDMMAAVPALVENAEAIGAITVETSVTNMLKVIDSASREISGTFKEHDGSELPW